LSTAVHASSDWSLSALPLKADILNALTNVRYAFACTAVLKGLARPLRHGGFSGAAALPANLKGCEGLERQQKATHGYRATGRHLPLTGWETHVSEHKAAAATYERELIGAIADKTSGNSWRAIAFWPIRGSSPTTQQKSPRPPH